MKNLYKVTAAQWERWTETQHQVFNSVYLQMTSNPELYSHPKMDKIPEGQWKTVCWNAAWTAADAVLGVNAASRRD